VKLPVIPTAISYDIPIHPQDRDSISLGDTFIDPTADSAELVKREEKRQRIAAALKLMRPNERITILLRASGMTLEEIGARMGVCRERVRQWERDARLVAVGKPRWACTEKAQKAEAKRRRSARARYAADESLRKKEIARVCEARRKRRRA
jgi:DNA-binding CsgD family transcriptional regulator